MLPEYSSHQGQTLYVTFNIVATPKDEDPEAHS